MLSIDSIAFILMNVHNDVIPVYNGAHYDTSYLTDCCCTYLRIAITGITVKTITITGITVCLKF